MKKRKISFVNISRRSMLGLILVVVNVLVIGMIFVNNANIFNKSAVVSTAKASTEIEGILRATNEEEKVFLYKKLIERVGPERAQEELNVSGIPYDGKSHLLNHTVGEWIYEHDGPTALFKCRDYFLSSCYHGFLIPLIAESKFSKLSEVMDSCWKIGQATATQCAHAIGHGLLAYEDYKNLPVALSDCDTVATMTQNFPTYNCYDGVFMENNWAVHEDGEPSPDRWIDESDLSYPCFDSRIDEKYRKACWSNQPQVAYRVVQGDLTKIIPMCAPLENPEYKETCYDSIARQIQPLVAGDVEKVFDYCDLMPTGWKSECVISISSSFYSLGDRVVPFTLCQMIPEEAKEACFDMLQQRISGYDLSLSSRTENCNKIPEEYKGAMCSKL